MILTANEERDDVSACTCSTCNNATIAKHQQLLCAGESTDSAVRTPPPAASLTDAVVFPQPIRFVIDDVPQIPNLQLDSVGSQQSSCGTGASQTANTAGRCLASRVYTEPLRRRRPRSCYEDDESFGDRSDHRRPSLDSLETTLSFTNNHAPEQHAGQVRARFRPRLLLRPRRLLHNIRRRASTSSTFLHNRLHYGPPNSSVKNRHRLIPAEHPLKLLWDMLTVVLSFVHAYATHQSIRDRQFGQSWLVRFCEVWFMVDIMLNFFTERHVSGRLLSDYKSVWARYLTSWFVVDVLSVVPFEVLYVQPIIEQQNRRGFFQKSFFRTKAVVRVSHLVLKNGYIPLFGKAARQTKSFGIGANRLLQLLIRYLPKYLLFLRNMKAILAVRVLRQVHWLRKVYHIWRRTATEQKLAAEAVERAQIAAQAEEELTALCRDQDDVSLDSLDHHRLLYYDDWELVEDDREDDDDDGSYSPVEHHASDADDGSDNDGYPY
jgi:hypothetical protein